MTTPSPLPAEEHNHASEPKLWCETHQLTHIAAMPRFTYLCKDCAWGQWYGDQAREHEAWTQENLREAHTTYEVEHVMSTPPTITDESWQYCYVEKWADGSGVKERITFRDYEKARCWFEDSAEDVEAWNREVKKRERVVASIERRRVVEPGPWEPVAALGGEA